MKKTTLFAFAFLIFGFPSHAQEEDSKKLFALIYTPGENWNHAIAFHEQPYFKEHSKHLQMLRKTGQIVVGGRFSDKGFLLLQAKDSLDARKTVGQDLSVTHRTFHAELFEFVPFYEGWVGKPKPKVEEAKLTGIGAIFLQSKNPESTRKWYAEKLGIPYNENGTAFQWRAMNHPMAKGVTFWDLFAENDPYFKIENQDHMINYRVNNLEAFLAELKQRGVSTIGEMQELEHGKFAWIMDPEGRKVELWEPNEKALQNLGKTLKSN